MDSGFVFFLALGAILLGPIIIGSASNSIGTAAFLSAIVGLGARAVEVLHCGSFFPCTSLLANQQAALFKTQGQLILQWLGTSTKSAIIAAAIGALTCWLKRKLLAPRPPQ